MIIAPYSMATMLCFWIEGSGVCAIQREQLSWHFARLHPKMTCRWLHIPNVNTVVNTDLCLQLGKLFPCKWNRASVNSYTGKLVYITGQNSWNEMQSENSLLIRLRRQMELETVLWASKGIPEPLPLEQDCSYSTWTRKLFFLQFLQHRWEVYWKNYQ